MGWRHHFAIERLRPSFSGDIAERIDDTTPLWVPGGPANRFQEIMAFVCSRGLDEAGWLALDDSAFGEFSPGLRQPGIVTAASGLTEDVAMRLAGRLAPMSGEVGGNAPAHPASSGKPSRCWINFHQLPM
ncbi:MAG: hypothetical protein IPG33_10595 [Betaproteobacteria bacterium]|nr:hypothetical protein [Betaproteobacteria bacterium]